MTKYPMHSEALTTNSQPKRRTLGPHSSLGILDFFGYLGIWVFRHSGSSGLGISSLRKPPSFTLRGFEQQAAAVGAAASLEIAA
jgi:hypothetical protein